ncbi:unnamed protein product [Heterobilharzia americana]|nr:unnamed protein product [Heterobilharzia americana]
MNSHWTLNSWKARLICSAAFHLASLSYPTFHKIMSAAIDVLDILDFNESSTKKSVLDKEALLTRADKRKSSRPNPQPKRPEHVPREVWGLHSTLNSNDLPPIMPTDNTPLYKQPKAVIGVGRVRPWQWIPFTNSARQDNLVLYHWRREVLIQMPIRIITLHDIISMSQFLNTL